MGKCDPIALLSCTAESQQRPLLWPMAPAWRLGRARTADPALPVTPRPPDSIIGGHGVEIEVEPEAGAFLVNQPALCGEMRIRVDDLVGRNRMGDAFDRDVPTLLKIAARQWRPRAAIAASECDRADVRQAREAWKAERRPKMQTEPHRLVFIDETGTNTKMTRARGRCERGDAFAPRPPLAIGRPRLSSPGCAAAP